MKVLNSFLLLMFISQSLGNEIDTEDFSGSFQDLLDDGWSFQGWSDCDDLSFFNGNGNCPDWISGDLTRWEISSSFGDINTTAPALIYNWSPSTGGNCSDNILNAEFEHEMTSKPFDVQNNTEVLVRFDVGLDYFQQSNCHINGLTVSYNGGNGWIDILNYELAPGITIPNFRQNDSFLAEGIELGSDLQLKWKAYGTNSYWINAWAVDNLEILSLPKLTSVSIQSENEDPSTASSGTEITLDFTASSLLIPSPYVQINGDSCGVESQGSNRWVALYTVQDSDPDGPIEFTIDFTDDDTGLDGATVKETSDETRVVIDNSAPPDFTVGEVSSLGGNVFSEIWNSTNTDIQLAVGVPQDSAVVSFEYTLGNSLSFDGNGNQVLIPKISDYQFSNTFTVEAWIKPLQPDNYEGFLNLAIDNGATKAGFGFVYYATGWRFYIETSETSFDYSSMPVASAAVDQWTHLAATYNGSELIYYKNGNAISTTEVSGDLEWLGSPNNLTFGAFTKDGVSGYYKGKIDEVRLWNIARSGQQIKASRAIALGGDEEGLVGYWQIDEGSGSSIGDSTTIENHGSISGATWVIEDSPLEFKFPVYDTGVIVGSAFQLMSRTGVNDFQLVGIKDTITDLDLETGTMQVSVSKTDFEEITGFAHDEIAQFTASLFDVAGNSINGDTSLTNTLVDIQANAPTTTSIFSNNSFTHLAKTGDRITVNIEFDENMEIPVVSFHGNSSEAETGSDREFQATYLLSGEEPEGNVEFSLLATDYLGNQNIHVGLTDGSYVIYDRTKPQLNTVTVNSLNIWNQSWATVNDGANINTIASENLLTISGTINDQPTVLVPQSLIEHDLNYTFSDSDPEGIIQFEINFSDSSGNEGDVVSSTTNNSNVILDKTPPIDFTVGNIISTGGNVVNSIWNLTNTGLELIIPIDSDSTLDSGRVQVLAKIGSNAFETLGALSFIESNELGSIKTISIEGGLVRALTGYTENDTISLNAIIYDIPGNETQGIESTTKLLIDETPPSLITVSYESNFSDSTLATVGDEIILTFTTDVEILTPIVSISTNATEVSELSSNNWQAVYVMDEGDEEGLIPFLINIITDINGNPTSDTENSPTDETAVFFDNTQPTLAPVSIESNNPNPGWAKTGDTITITFTGEEPLSDQSGTIMSQSVDIIALGDESYKTQYELINTDPEGQVEFEIIVIDRVELQSEPVIETTDGSLVTFDRTSPTLPTVHIESDNENNNSIAIAEDNIDLLFIPNEPLILDSISVSIADQSADISESSGTYTATITMTGSEPEGIISYTIDYKDRAGNPGIQVLSTTDESTVSHDVYPPEIEMLSISSSNLDSTWAKIGDTIFITFTASEVLDNINLFITGDFSNCVELGSRKYRGSHILDSDDNEGEVSFSLTYTDLGGAEGTPMNMATNDTRVRLDKTPPEFSLISMATNNIYGDSLAGLGTIDTLSFTISEQYRDLVVELAESEKTAIQEGLAFYGTHTFTESNEDGWVGLALSMTDSASNESGVYSNTQDGTLVRFDGTPPSIDSVFFFSNNNNDSSLCIPGDSLYLSYFTNEFFRSVDIQIAENAPDRISGSGIAYTAVYYLTGAEAEGFIPFNINNYEDWVGNTGISVSETTNGNTVLFDMTPPADFTLGSISTTDTTETGVFEVPGYWNSFNQNLKIVVPVADDATLVDGQVQIEVSFGAEFQGVDFIQSITNDDLSTDVIVEIEGSLFEGLDDYLEGSNALFRALLWDKAGNLTTSSQSATIIHIDETLPVLSLINQSSNNLIADSLAKVGDTDTLTFVSSEGLDSINIQIFNSNVTPFGSNTDWRGAYVFSDDDTDGPVPFSISLSDTAGNFVYDISNTTDLSWIRFDRTIPILGSASFSSSNSTDPELANIGDTLFLNFESSEDLVSQVVTIAGMIADTVFVNEARIPYTSWYILNGSEDEGYIPFSIAFTDLVGNNGDTVQTTTDGSSILFDLTPPSDFQIDTVYVRGGNVKAGYWNASNDTIIIKIPVPDNDETLIGGSFQAQVSADLEGFNPIGDSFLIDSLDLGTNKNIYITNPDSFVEDVDLVFTAIARDRAGNETIGNSNNLILHVDQVYPTLISVGISSNNELDTNWAKVSDTIRLQYTSSEGLFSPSTNILSDTILASSTNSGLIWLANKKINNNEPQGVIPFIITYSDSAGNIEIPLSSSTNGSLVKLDRREPSISEIFEGQNEMDIDYYNKSDSLTLFWSHSDSLSGIRDAFVALGTDSNSTDILNWTISGNEDFSGIGSLNLINNSIYFGGAFVRDSAGNHSDTIWGNGIYIDIQNPDTGSIIDGYWVMDLDYSIDSTQLSYVWSNFTDNTGIDHYEIAIGTGLDSSNVLDWIHTDSTDSMTITGLSLVRDTSYYTYIKAVDLATNTSFSVSTDGIYFDNSFPLISNIYPDFESDSAGFLSVLKPDTLIIKFNRPIYTYNLNSSSNVDSSFSSTHLYGDSTIYVMWQENLSSYDTLQIIIDSAVAYNTLTVSDTLYFYSKLWGDLNNDYDIDINDIFIFNKMWPQTDLAPFKNSPPHVQPEPDGEVNLEDLTAFAKMWQWKYFSLSYDTTETVSRLAIDLDVLAVGNSLIFQVPTETVMAELLIGESNLDIKNISFYNPRGSAFSFNIIDTLNNLKQFSIADHLGFDSTITLKIPDTEEHVFTSKLQYRFLNKKGEEIEKGITLLKLDILPDKFKVFNNYPNPFNPVTRIRYDLPDTRDVNIKIFDLLGRTVKSFELKNIAAGRHTFTWEGRNSFGEQASTGVYFMQLTAGKETKIQKMLLLK